MLDQVKEMLLDNSLCVLCTVSGKLPAWNVMLMHHCGKRCKCGVSDGDSDGDGSSARLPRPSSSQ